MRGDDPKGLTAFHKQAGEYIARLAKIQSGDKKELLDANASQEREINELKAQLAKSEKALDDRGSKLRSLDFVIKAVREGNTDVVRLLEEEFGKDVPAKPFVE